METPGPGSTVGHYRLIERIGAGAMGVVYRARDERLDRDVAIKVLPAGSLDDDTARRRFRKEALLLSKVNHPNVATIHDFNTESGVDYLVMEYIPGVSLSDRIQAGGLSEPEIRSVGVQLARGLAAAHALGIVHRDLKPGNLRMTPDGRLKILDFGLAQLLQPAATETGSRAMELAGTLPYMAPEQILGNSLDARTDIYAAGAVLYELAAGRRPFDDSTGAELMAAILQREPRRPRTINAGISEALEASIVAALSKNPATRQQSAEALAQELDPSSGERIVRPRRRLIGRRTAAAALAILGLLIAAALFSSRLMRPARVAPGRITVAVLPLHVQSAPAAARFLAVGIPDAIITRLAGVPQLLPRPTSAILRYENQSIDLQEIGRALACEYVLTGILQEAGERLRVSVQLVRSRDGAPIWGNHYDLVPSDLLMLQDQMARAVADALEVQMSAAERARIFRRYTENPAAYGKYLEGRADLVRYTPDSVRASIEAFEAALRLDPSYAPAHAGLGMACAIMRLRFASDSETGAWSERAEREARAALRLDPQIAEAHEALAAVYRAVEFKWEEAIEESRLALDLNPNLDQPHLYRAAAFYHLGLLDLVEPDVRAALDINPENRVDAARTRGVSALFSGRFRDAIAALDEARELGHSSAYNYFLGLAYSYAGEPDKAEQWLAPLTGAMPSERRGQAIRASLLANRGRRNDALALIRTVLDSRFMDHHVAYSLGVAYAQLGDAGEARRWLAEAARIGFPCYPWYQRDPLLDPVRRDPDFQRFLGDLHGAWQRVVARYGSRATS